MEALRTRVQFSMFPLHPPRLFFFLRFFFEPPSTWVPDEEQRPLLTYDGYVPGGRRVAL